MKGLLGQLGQFKRIQSDLEKAVKQMADAKFVGEAGDGAVKVTLSGTKELLSVKIEPHVASGHRAEALGKLVVAAAKDAFNQAEQNRKETLETALDGLPIPPGLLNI